MPIAKVSVPRDLMRVLTPYGSVLEHTVRGMSGRRWQRAVAAAGLPAPTGPLAVEGSFELSRREILTFAESEIGDDTAMQLLYMSLAWGLGAKGFRMDHKMRGIGEKGVEPVAMALVEAWSAVREGRDPQTCYEVLLSPKGRPRVKQLGAAFATKYLYFAGGLSPTRTPILDAVVARTLRPLAWPGSPTTAWWSTSYAGYADLLERWAAEASAETGALVRVDQIEMTLFNA